MAVAIASERPPVLAVEDNLITTNHEQKGR